MPDTPELDKMSEAKEYSQKIGEFLDWLVSEKHIVFSRYHQHVAHCFTLGMTKTQFREAYKGKRKGTLGIMTPKAKAHELVAGRFDDAKCCMHEGELVPEQVQIERTLAEFFEIDLDKVERERRAILDALQNKG